MHLPLLLWKNLFPVSTDTDCCKSDTHRGRDVVSARPPFPAFARRSSAGSKILLKSDRLMVLLLAKPTGRRPAETAGSWCQWHVVLHLGRPAAAAISILVAKQSPKAARVRLDILAQT